jgi:chemotaxis response regulator CheB
MFRIVIANEDQTTNAQLERWLKSHDAIHVVGVATSGLDALDLVWECEPNVVVFGSVRPPMGGSTLLRLVHAARPRTLLVALDDAIDSLSSLHAEAHACLRHDSDGRLQLLPV